MRLQYAAHGIAHANGLRAFDDCDHFDVAIEEHSKTGSFAELAREFPEKR